MTRARARRRAGRRGARALVLVVSMLVLASCQLDISVTMTMDEDGTGTITVDASTDAELADEVPDLADILELADAERAGWIVDGPAPNNEGGLDLQLTHAFRDADEATVLLSSLGGPFTEIELTRALEGGGSDASATNTLRGSATLEGGGFTAFADQRLLEAIGDVPFRDELEGVTPDESLHVDLAVELPGDIDRSTGDKQGRTVTWQLPLDGSTTDIELISQQVPDQPSGWARPLATAALIALILWLALSAWFVTFAVRRRRQLAARRAGQRTR